MNQYRKKPVVIEAMQFTWDSGKSVHDWLIENGVRVIAYHEDGKVWELGIPTLEGEMCASRGDWIIKGVKGEF